MLLLAATPIGNLGDASPRLRETLQNAAVIAAEDSRRIGQLMSLLEIERQGEIVVVHDHNERAKAEQLALRALHDDVVLVSDAGMPTVSDPGFSLVRAAHDAGAQVSVIPGPSAVLSALAVSGLPTDRFSFEGFVPRKSGDRAKHLHAVSNDQRTLVFFDSPHRLAETLADMTEVFGGDRPAAVCRELTKLHEEVRRGSLAELAAWAAAGVRGEIVIVVGGSTAATDTLNDETRFQQALIEVMGRVALGEQLKPVTREVSARVDGVTSKSLYDEANRRKGLNRA